MESALLGLLVVLFAVIAMVWLLNRISCPFCQSKTIVPKAGDAHHGYGTFFECLGCKKTFRLFSSIQHNAGDKKD